MKILNKKINNSYLFLGIVILVYLIVAIFNFDLARNGLGATLSLLSKILPILVVVIVINFIINKYLKEEKVVKYLGKDSGKLGIFYAVIVGILIGGPPYILYPLLKDLKNKGMKDSLIAIFLYNRNVKIPFLPVMIYYFGLTFTIIISIYIIIFSLISGILMELFLKNKENV